MCTAQLDYIGERTYSAVGLYWRKNVCRQHRWINSEILTYRVFGLYRKSDSQIISEIERTAHSDYIGNLLMYRAVGLYPQPTWSILVGDRDV